MECVVLNTCTYICCTARRRIFSLIKLWLHVQVRAVIDLQKFATLLQHLFYIIAHETRPAR